MVTETVTLDERIAAEIAAAVQRAKLESEDLSGQCWVCSITGIGQGGYYEIYSTTTDTEHEMMETLEFARVQAWALAVVSPSGEVKYTFYNRDVIDYQHRMENRKADFKSGDLVLADGYFYGFIDKKYNDKTVSWRVKNHDDNKLFYEGEIIPVGSPEWEALLKTMRPDEVERSTIRLWYLNERTKLEDEYTRRIVEVRDRDRRG